MNNRSAANPGNPLVAIRYGVLVAVAIGAFAPVSARAGDFSVGNAATFAQNIIEPDSAFRSGGAIPEPPAAAGGDFAGIFQRDPGGAGGAPVSDTANSGHLADTAADETAALTAKLPVLPAPVEPMTTAPRPSYRWQTLVPGVLK